MAEFLKFDCLSFCGLCALGPTITDYFNIWCKIMDTSIDTTRKERWL